MTITSGTKMLIIKIESNLKRNEYNNFNEYYRLSCDFY
jgi:hypothetical protein